MARNRARNGRASAARRITNVRMVPDGEGTRAEKVNRMLASVKEQQGQIRVVVKGSSNVGLGTAGVVTVNFDGLRVQADFVSIAAQFRTAKVSGIRFDVYDINPAANQPGIVIGTYHGRTAGDAPTTFGNVTDLSDSRLVPVSEGVYTWYWYPTGPAEESWYSTTDSVTNFGGLALYLPASGTQPKYQVITSWIVDFRARY